MNGRTVRFIGTVLLFVVPQLVRADHILLQVEDFEGPWRRQTNIPGYLGRGFCTSNANPNIASSTMTGKAAIHHSGEYVIWVRGYTSANSRRALRVEVNEQLLAVTHDGKTRAWSWQRAGEVHLPTGEVRIVVHDADVGYECADAVLITDRKEYDPMAEDKQWSIYDGNVPERADALRFNIEACSELARQRPNPQTLADWRAKRKQLRRKLAKALGLSPLPPRTPLNAQVTGRAERELYTIENLVFESRPRFYITANLYIPKNTSFPAPAVVVVPGHAMKEGKNYPPYQMAMIGLARLGFVVLAYDPIGQGERRLPEFGHHLGYSLLLVGQTNEGIITWDTMRAIDYLCTRPEVDPKRIGLTGNSGGGLNSLYAPPIDRRIKVAASFCFVCSYDQWIRLGGNHCICNHLPGIVREMEEFEVVGLIALRPFLMGNGAEDPIFPIAGTRDTYRRAKSIYNLYAIPQKLALVEVDAGHGWHQPLREACYGWMMRWLRGHGTGDPIPEESYEAEAWDSPDLMCFKDGKMPENHETLVTLARSMGRGLIRRYNRPPKSARSWKGQAETFRRNIWEVFGGKPRDRKPRARDVGSFEADGHTVQGLRIITEPGMEVPALLIWPKQQGRPCPVLIFVDERGKLAVRNSPVAKMLLEKGATVLAIDPRGLGEVDAAGGSGDYNQVTSDSVVLGRPLLAQQTWDVIQAARCLRSTPGIAPGRVACYGWGAGGLIALFAAALSDDIRAVATERTITSYLYAIEDSQPQPRWIFVPNILKAADIPQIAALVAPRPTVMANPVGFGRQILVRNAAAEELQFAQAVFAVLKREENLEIPVGDESLAQKQIVESLGRAFF